MTTLEKLRIAVANDKDAANSKRQECYRMAAIHEAEWMALSTVLDRIDAEVRKEKEPAK